MKDNKKVVSDLHEVIAVVNTSKEKYHAAADTTYSPELKTIFGGFIKQRAKYIKELTSHISVHGGRYQERIMASRLYRFWLKMLQQVYSKKNAAILSNIIPTEKETIKQYDEYIADHSGNTAHSKILKKQRNGIEEALAVIQNLKVRFLKK